MKNHMPSIPVKKFGRPSSPSLVITPQPALCLPSLPSIRRVSSMDPSSFYNNNSGSAYNASHRSASSNQHLNPNNPSSQLVSNGQSVSVTNSMSAGQAAAAVGGVSGASYPAGFARQGAANNAQYRLATAAAAGGGGVGRPLSQPHVYGGTQASVSVPQTQHNVVPNSSAHFTSAPRQAMYSAGGRAAVASPPASAGYGVPNPLGAGGVPGAVPGAGPAAQVAAATAPQPVAAPPPGVSKTDLLRSMYQSRARQQQQQQQQQAAQNGVVASAQQPGQPYRPPVVQAPSAQGIQQQQQGMQQRVSSAVYASNVQSRQQQSASNYHQSPQGPVAVQPSPQVVQQNYPQQQQRSASQMTSHAHLIQQQNRQVASQQIQHAQHSQQQRQQVSQQVSHQAYQQQQSSRLNVQQYAQQQQQGQHQQVRQSSSQAATQQQQQKQHNSSSSGRQKQKFHLTPEAKVALREAVLSAIRHPNGEVDPGCLQRAMNQGLPKQAILNAAVVARQRDKRNREERRLQQQQQQGTSQQQGVQHQQQHSRQTHGQQPSVQQLQQQGTVVHNPGMSRSVAPAYPPHNPAASNQHIYSSQKGGTAMPYGQTTQPQYGQTAQQQLYQQQQAAQQRQREQQLQQQAKMTQYQRQLQAQQQAQQKAQQQAQQAQQRKAAEEARRKKQLQYQQEQQRRAAAAQAQAREAQEKRRRAAREAEQQRRMLEEQKRRREREAARAAEEAKARRDAALAATMKPWGRMGFALVVKEGAKGLSPPPPPQNKNKQNPMQHVASAAKAVLQQSPWGGASMSLYKGLVLGSALKRVAGEKRKESPADAPPEKVKQAVELIRKQLMSQPLLADGKPTRPSRDDLHRRRFAAITAKLMGQPDQLKRYKVQPKRESKFLDKHIRRARQMTADAHSKRHKELLKAIVSHQSEFYKFHRGKRSDAAKLARSIRDQFRKAEAAKEKEEGQAEKARLAALRANDMAAYTSLLEDTKNERLKFLLDKTDECMNQISTLLTSRVAEEEEDIKMMGGEGTIKVTFSENVTGGSYYETAHVKSEQVRQPSILTGGDLKEYQLSGLQWLVSLYNNRLNGILADEMGLGKTIQTISLIAYLIEAKQNLGPYLVIVPLSTLSNWVNEFAKWLPAATVICYKGSPQQRKQLFRDEVADGHFNVLLTTYEFVIRDKGSLKKIAWQYAIVDEGHRMKNNQSKFALTLGTQYNTRRRVLLTGTPLQNNLPELWALLNFLLPAIFNSAETFDDWFNKPFSSFGKSATADDPDGSSNELLSNEERLLIIHRLHELLRPFMLRRVKSEVLDQLPTKVEKVIRCELSSWQKELYKQISSKIAGEAATKNFNRGLNNVVMQLRKVCNHPYLFSKDGYHINEDVIRASGKVELLDRMLPKLKAAGHRVLMFTQMTKMMPILEDYFAYRGFSSLRLDGSTTADEREKRMYMFNAPDSPYFIFLLSTRAGGLGLNLATADTVIIFDSDWNPMMDLQAQDRAHRIGQRKDVRVFRIITQTPVEEKILSRATEKLQMNELVVEAGKFDKSGQGKEDNSLERLKMMELLLTDFDQNQTERGAATSEEDFENDTNDGEEEDSKDLLNEMISSNDDDYTLYCKMDMERTDAPALYANVEDCPDWIRYPNGKPDENQDLLDDGQPEFLGKRRAAAGDKVYDDGLTEKQFCRMMDKQATEEEKDKKKRKKKRSRNAVDPSLILEDDGAPRKRGKVTHFELDDSKTSRSKASAAVSVSSVGNGEVTADINDRLISVTRSVIYFKDKKSKRKLSEIFLEKPCPHTYPDYYQVVENPIGMNDILRKCRAKLYATINDFREDWNTLFENALTYNGKGSWIVTDGEILQGELDRLMDKNALGASTGASKKPVRIKLSFKKGGNKKET